MKISKEHFLAIKISTVLLALLIFIFAVLLYLNFTKSIEEEKQKFLHDIELIPTHHLLSIIAGTQSDLEGVPRKKVERVMQNIYIDIKGKTTIKKGLFEYVDFDDEGFDSVPEKKVYLWKNGEDKVLLFKRENTKITFIIGKNVEFIQEGLLRLLSISAILGLFSLFLLYLFAFKIAKNTFAVMKSANQRLKDYNHNVAHELKTPLAIMKSNLELLELDYSGNKSLITSSQEEITEMETIIDTILFLSEHEANNKNLEKDNIVLKKYIKEASTKYCKRVNISVDTLNNIIKVKANKALLKRLLKNIFENAEKYKKEKTEIIVKISEKKSKVFLTVENRCRDDCLKHLSNIDNLFQSFTKADNSRHSSGYGLGLSIVKKICELHLWKVSICIKKDVFIVTIEM